MQDCKQHTEKEFMIFLLLEQCQYEQYTLLQFPENMVEEVEQHWDCLIIGAGISGLDAAYHLKVCQIRMREMKEDFIIVN